MSKQRKKRCGEFGGRNRDGSPCQKRTGELCHQHAKGATPDVRGGKPRLDLSGTQIEQVEKLAALGLTQDQIGSILGMSGRTLKRRIAENPKVRGAFVRGKALMIAEAAQNLLQQSKAGNVAATIFILKAQGKWSEKIQLEHSGQLTIEQWLRDLSPADLRRLEALGDDELLEEYERATAEGDD